MGHITHLPVELLLLLFTYLDLSSINSLRITCHLLYVQTPNRIRYHTLILPRSLQLSSTLTLFALWRKNNALPYIKSLVITGEGTITPALAVNFLTACPNLEKLSISNHPTFSIDYFVNLLDSIGQLRNASVINKRQWKLQSIEITYCVGVHQYSKDISVPFQRSTIATLERKLSQLKPRDSAAAVNTSEDDSPHLQPYCELSSPRVGIVIHECNRWTECNICYKFCHVCSKHVYDYHVNYQYCQICAKPFCIDGGCVANIGEGDVQCRICIKSARSTCLLCWEQNDCQMCKEARRKCEKSRRRLGRKIGKVMCLGR